MSKDSDSEDDENKKLYDGLVNLKYCIDDVITANYRELIKEQHIHNELKQIAHKIDKFNSHGGLKEKKRILKRLADMSDNISVVRGWISRGAGHLEDLSSVLMSICMEIHGTLLKNKS